LRWRLRSREEVAADDQAAVRQQIQATPTLIMSGTKGSEIVPAGNGGYPSYSQLAAAVTAVS